MTPADFTKDELPRDDLEYVLRYFALRSRVGNMFGWEGIDTESRAKLWKQRHDYDTLKIIVQDKFPFHPDHPSLAWNPSAPGEVLEYLRQLANFASRRGEVAEFYPACKNKEIFAPTQSEIETLLYYADLRKRLAEVVEGCRRTDIKDITPDKCDVHDLQSMIEIAISENNL